MAAAKIINFSGSKSKSLTRCLTGLMLFCLCAGSIQVFAHQIVKSADLVFCPIQKIWVQKYVAPVKVKKPLDEICASNQQKDRFFFEMSKKMPLLRFIHDSGQTEKLFFNYLEKGKRAFAEISPSENLPQRQLARLAATQKSAGSDYKTDFDEIQAEVFTLAQAARPPTAQKSASFETLSFRPLETISRRIQPRAPPARS